MLRIPDADILASDTYTVPAWVPIDPLSGAVLCPVCGFEFTHIERVGCRLGTDGAEGGGYRGVEIDGVCDERRACLVIVFAGECGHRFEWRIQQHKGYNFFSRMASAVQE